MRQPEHERTGQSTRQPWQDSHDRITGIGHSGQINWDMPLWTGRPELTSLDRTERRGCPEYDRMDRSAGIMGWVRDFHKCSGGNVMNALRILYCVVVINQIKKDYNNRH
jgi:hypothetical protein